jgi:hypothetical protein
MRHATCTSQQQQGCDVINAECTCATPQAAMDSRMPLTAGTASSWSTCDHAQVQLQRASRQHAARCPPRVMPGSRPVGSWHTHQVPALQGYET